MSSASVPETMASFFTPVPITHPLRAATKPVARYGRIYKRKEPSPTLGFASLPCPPGHRYCSDCRTHLPLDRFYSGPVRYMCRKHHYLRVQRRLQERMRLAPLERLATNAWRGLLQMGSLLGYERPEYDSHDFKDLVALTSIPVELSPTILPIDPAKPLRPRNVAILTMQDRLLLMRIYVASGSRAQYILFAQAVNLLPRNADAGVPWDPYHDPEYRREDIDVTPLLEEEKLNPPTRPILDVMDRMQKGLPIE